MSTIAPPRTHITIDAGGRPWIEGTSYRVTRIVIDHLVHGWTAEEIRANHYEALILGEIHAAPAYCFDNREAIDLLMDREEREIEQVRVRLEALAAARDGQGLFDRACIPPEPALSGAEGDAVS